MNESLSRRILAILLAAAALALPGGGLAEGGSGRPGDNVAVAINTKDDSSRFKLAFDVTRETDEVVDNQNIAYARSSCLGCRTSAIAVQIVLVTGSPTTVKPVNLALAENVECTSCQTFASAYQFVIGRGNRLRFTHEGWKELSEIRHDLKKLRKEELAPAQLDAEVSALMDELREVLDTELVPAREGEDAGPVVSEVTAEDEPLAPAERPRTAGKLEKERQFRVDGR